MDVTNENPPRRDAQFAGGGDGDVVGAGAEADADAAGDDVAQQRLRGIVDFVIDVDVVATMPHVDGAVARDAAIDRENRSARAPCVAVDSGMWRQVAGKVIAECCSCCCYSE